MCSSPTVASAASSTWVVSVRRTLRSTWLRPGHLLEPGPRRVLRDDLGCDDLEWARGRAWAFEQAMGVAWYYADSNPAMHRMGLITLDRILTASG